MDKCLAKHHPTPPSAFTWRKLTPPKRVTRQGWPGNLPRWGTPPLMWKQSRKRERLYGNPTKAGDLTYLGSLTSMWTGPKRVGNSHSKLACVAGVRRWGKGERRAREAREGRTREDRGRGRPFSIPRLFFDFPSFLRPATEANAKLCQGILYRLVYFKPSFPAK